MLEDDVWFHPHTRRVLSWIQTETVANRLPFSGEKTCLLRLGWARNAEHDAQNAAIRAEQIVRMSNPCHAITRAYARALIERDKGIIHTADVYQHELAPRPGEAFTIFPPIASELSWTEGRFASLIHPKPIHADYLRNTGDLAAANEAERRVARHVKKKFYRPLLITGHSHCGLATAVDICRRSGLHVGQNRAAEHGLSSWMFAVDADINPVAHDEISRTRRALVWKYMIVPVRDLQTAAPLVAAEDQGSAQFFDFRRAQILAALGIDISSFISPLERAVRSIISWMRILVAQQPHLIFRVEDQQALFQDFLVKTLLASTSPATDPNVEHGQTPDESWEAFTDETKREIEWYCEQFGYASPLR